MDEFFLNHLMFGKYMSLLNFLFYFPKEYQIFQNIILVLLNPSLHI